MYTNKQSSEQKRSKEAEPLTFKPVKRKPCSSQYLAQVQPLPVDNSSATINRRYSLLQPQPRHNTHSHAISGLEAQEPQIMPSKRLSNLIDGALRSTSTCGICTDPFSASHPPVALRCTHIFGHRCIKKWLLSRNENSNTCPLCRSAIFEAGTDDSNVDRTNSNRGTLSDSDGTDAELWRALCEIAKYEEQQQHDEQEESELIHEFMFKMWEGVCGMCQRHRPSHPQETQNQGRGRHRRLSSSSSFSSSCSSPSSSSLPSTRENAGDPETTPLSFTAAEYLLGAILPALMHTSCSPNLAVPSSTSLRQQYRKNRLVFLETSNLLHATYLSLDRPSTFTHGLTIPLVRLARLMAQSSSIMPRWLTSVPRMNLLFWNANACLGGPGELQIEQVSWKHIQEAALLTSPRYFPLLHLYTVLISQTLVHLPISQKNPSSILERCCTRVGGSWADSPSSALKQLCVAVYTDLKRCQVEGCALSLRAKTGESDVVRGLWGVAGWILKR